MLLAALIVGALVVLGLLELLKRKNRAQFGSLRVCPDGPEVVKQHRTDAWRVLRETYGDTFVFNGAVATCDPEVITKLLMDRKHSEHRSQVYKLFARVCPYADGILCMDGDPHKRHSRAMLPLFQPAAIEAHAALASHCCRSWLRRTLRAGGAGGQGAAVPDLLAGVRRVAQDFLLRYGYGIDADHALAEPLRHELHQYSVTCFERLSLTNWPVVYPQLWLCARRIGALARQLLATRAYEDHTPNLVQAMVQQRDIPLEELISEVNHLHGAHKAAAFTATCLLFRLSVHEDWRRRVVEEFKQLQAREARTGALPAVPIRATEAQEAEERANWAASGASASWHPRRDHLASGDALPVFRAVFHETLRLHVVSMGVMRRTGLPLEVTDKDGKVVVLPAGMEMVLLLHGLHTHSAHWKDPDQFDPARWLTPDGRFDASLAPKNAFHPFLNGQRRCLGLYLAELEACVYAYEALVSADLRATRPLDSWRMSSAMFSLIEGDIPAVVRPAPGADA